MGVVYLRVNKKGDLLFRGSLGELPDDTGTIYRVEKKEEKSDTKEEEKEKEIGKTKIQAILGVGSGSTQYSSIDLDLLDTYLEGAKKGNEYDIEYDTRKNNDINNNRQV